MRRFGVAVLAVVGGIALSACGADDPGAATVPTVSETGEDSSPASTPPSTSPPLSEAPLPPESPPISAPESTLSPELPGTPIDPTMPLVTAAVEDLAERLGMEPDAVTVAAAQAVTWPDGSLGCPEPGMMYTQALVDGTLVVLEAGGRRYEYHGGNPLVLCEHPKPPAEG